jgi:hypothetical protein
VLGLRAPELANLNFGKVHFLLLLLGASGQAHWYARRSVVRTLQPRGRFQNLGTVFTQINRKKTEWFLSCSPLFGEGAARFLLGWLGPGFPTPGSFVYVRNNPQAGGGEALAKSIQYNTSKIKLVISKMAITPAKERTKACIASWWPKLSLFIAKIRSKLVATEMRPRIKDYRMRLG